MDIVRFTDMFGLNPEDCQGAIEGFEIEVEPDQVCIFDIKVSLAAVSGIG